MVCVLACSWLLQAQSSFCQRTISTAAALTALCNDPDSPLSPTYYSGLRFPATPVSATSKAINLTALSRRDPATGALTALDPATAWVAPSAAAGPPVACSGVGLLLVFKKKVPKTAGHRDHTRLVGAAYSDHRLRSEGCKCLHRDRMTVQFAQC